MKLNRKRVRDLAKNKKTLINTVRLAASDLAVKKYHDGRKDGMMAMLSAMQKEFHFGPERLRRAVASAQPILNDIDKAPDIVDTMFRYWVARGVLKE